MPISCIPSPTAHQHPGSPSVTLGLAVSLAESVTLIHQLSGFQESLFPVPICSALVALFPLKQRTWTLFPRGLRRV